MYVHHPGAVTLSAGLFSALAGCRREPARTAAVDADRPVAWIAGPPTDEDARLAWEICQSRAVTSYGALVDQLTERLFRRDLARVGGAADIGLLGSLYRAYAREVIRGLEGASVRIGGESRS
jgi:hypothetical protein